MDGHMQLPGAHEVTYNGRSLSLPHSLSLTCQPALGCSATMTSSMWAHAVLLLRLTPEVLAPLSIPRPRWSATPWSAESGSLEGTWWHKPEGQGVNTLWVNSVQRETREGRVPAGEFPPHTPSDVRLWTWLFGSAYLRVVHVAKKLAVSSWSNSQHHNVRPCATSHPPVTDFTSLSLPEITLPRIASAFNPCLRFCMEKNLDCLIVQRYST